MSQSAGGQKHPHTWCPKHCWGKSRTDLTSLGSGPRLSLRVDRRRRRPPHQKLVTPAFRVCRVNVWGHRPPPPEATRQHHPPGHTSHLDGRGRAELCVSPLRSSKELDSALSHGLSLSPALPGSRPSSRDGISGSPARPNLNQYRSCCRASLMIKTGAGNVWKANRALGDLGACSRPCLLQRRRPRHVQTAREPGAAWSERRFRAQSENTASPQTLQNLG